MRSSILLLLLVLSGLGTPVLATQTGDDPFQGSFHNQQYDLGLRLEKARRGYDGEFLYQGQSYPLTAFRLAGVLTGEYTYQGRKITFSVIKRGEGYTLLSEGVELPIVRGSRSTTTSEATPTPAPPPPPSTDDRLLADPQGVYTCQAPAGWTSTAENGGFILRNSGTPVTIILTSHQESNIDQALQQATDIDNPSENTRIRVKARKLNSTTAYALFQGTARNQPVNLELLTVFAPQGGGLVVTINYGAFSPNPAFLPIAQAIAASAKFPPSKESPLAQQWSERIRGKKLLFLQTDSYGSQRIDIQLDANGSYSYQSNTGMMSQGGVGTGTYGGLDRHAGSWKVITQGGSPVLMLIGQAGTTSYPIRQGASPQQILLNNRRYFIQPIE